MHTTIVTGADVALGVVVRLIAAPRIVQITQRVAGDKRRKGVLANLPGLRTLALDVSFNHRAEYVGHRFIERAAFTVVGQRGGVLRDAVKPLVTDDVQRDERPEQAAVAVARDDFLAVPERVVVGSAVVQSGELHSARARHRRGDDARAAAAVDTNTAVHDPQVVHDRRAREVQVVRGPLICGGPLIVRVGQTKRSRAVAKIECAQAPAGVLEEPRAADRARGDRDIAAIQRRARGGVQVVEARHDGTVVGVDENHLLIRQQSRVCVAGNAQLDPIHEPIDAVETADPQYGTRSRATRRARQCRDRNALGLRRADCGRDIDIQTSEEVIRDGVDRRPPQMHDPLAAPHRHTVV